MQRLVVIVVVLAILIGALSSYSKSKRHVLRSRRRRELARIVSVGAESGRQLLGSATAAANPAETAASSGSETGTTQPFLRVPEEGLEPPTRGL